MQNYCYFALLCGPAPPFNSISMPVRIAMAMHKTQMEQTPGPWFAPGLDIQKIFYGRTYVRPNLEEAIIAIGQDYADLIRDNPGFQALRVMHYYDEILGLWPDLKAEADSRPIYGDPELGKPNIYLIPAFDENPTMVQVEAECARDAVLLTTSLTGLSCHFSRPMLAKDHPEIEPDIIIT